MEKPGDEPLLLHSLTEHHEFIFAALEAAAPRRIVEIGSETGGFSKELMDWAGANGATLVTVEPYPTAELRELDRTVDHFELLAARSPAALEQLEPADAYVIDGDHNHWTVLRELRAAFGDRDPGPLAILHDVGWPCAHRDQYYAPEAIPREGRHPHSYDKGRHPDRSELVDVGGFHGAWQFAVALEEGGDRNGVLAAVEDFRGERGGLVYRQVDAVFGVGYLFSESAAYAPRLGELLDAWHDSALLKRLERNRVRLFARILELQDQLTRAGMRASRASLAAEDRLEQLEAENAALRLELQRVRERLANGAGPAVEALP